MSNQIVEDTHYSDISRTRTTSHTAKVSINPQSPKHRQASSQVRVSTHGSQVKHGTSSVVGVSRVTPSSQIHLVHLPCAKGVV